jgi:hypothetical protein
MSAPDGLFRPAGTVTAGDLAAVLNDLYINISSLTTLPSNPSVVLTKGQFLQILSEAFHTQLPAILRTKTQADYTRAWNAVPSTDSHAKSVRTAILAGWIDMPRTPFHGSATLTRAEMAKILVSVMKTVAAK